MKTLIKKYFPKLYYSMQRETLDEYFKWEFEMQQLEERYPNQSHGKQEYERDGKVYTVRLFFTEKKDE